MKRREFLENTVLKLSDELFEDLKKCLIGNKKLITFSFFSRDSITRELLAEKLTDYFRILEKEEKSFDELIKKYFEDWESIVDSKVAKEPKATRKNPNPTISRARRYYKVVVVKSKNVSIQSITDFTRIMMCLYAEIIKEETGVVDDFNLSTKDIDIKEILMSIQDEQKKMKKPVVGRKDLFFKNNWSRVVMIIMFYHIKNSEVAGEY